MWQWVEWFCDLFTQCSEVHLQKIGVMDFRLESCPMSKYTRDGFSTTEKQHLSVAGIRLVPAEPLLPAVPATSFSDFSLDNFSAGILQQRVNVTKHI